MLPRDRFVLRELYSRSNAPEVNCPIYAAFRLYKRRVLLRLLERALDGGRGRILDLGCGDGAETDFALCRLTELWRRPEKARELEVVFAEGDPRWVEVVAARVEDLKEILPGFRAEARQLDVAAPLPFADGSFDVVISSEVLEHLREPERAIAEIRRVLAPRGWLVFTTDNEPTLFGSAKRALGWRTEGVRERFLATGVAVPEHRVQVGDREVEIYGHINTRTSVEWERTLVAAGFELEEHGDHDCVVRHWGTPAPWKLAAVALGNWAASVAPAWLGRRMCATTALLLRRV